MLDAHLEKALASFTGAHPIMLTGRVVSTHCTASLISRGTLHFRRQVSIHQSRPITASRFQAKRTEGEGRTMLLVLWERVLIWKLRQLVQRKLISCDMCEREERSSRGQRTLLWSPAAIIWGARTVVAIPGRHGLVPWGWGRRCRGWTSKTVWTPWRRQRLIQVTKSECAWVTAVHLEVVQLERVMPRGGTWAGRCSTGGNLAGVGVKLANVTSDQRGDARQGGSGVLVPLVRHIHGQPGGEVRIQKLWAEEGALIGLDSMLTLNTGHFCRTKPQHLPLNTVDIAAETSIHTRRRACTIPSHSSRTKHTSSISDLSYRSKSQCYSIEAALWRALRFLGKAWRAVGPERAAMLTAWPKPENVSERDAWVASERMCMFDYTLETYMCKILIYLKISPTNTMRLLSHVPYRLICRKTIWLNAVRNVIQNMHFNLITPSPLCIFHIIYIIYNKNIKKHVNITSTKLFCSN